MRIGGALGRTGQQACPGAPGVLRWRAGDSSCRTLVRESVLARTWAGVLSRRQAKDAPPQRSGHAPKRRFLWALLNLQLTPVRILMQPWRLLDRPGVRTARADRPAIRATRRKPADRAWRSVSPVPVTRLVPARRECSDGCGPAIPGLPSPRPGRVCSPDRFHGLRWPACGGLASPVATVRGPGPGPTAWCRPPIQRGALPGPPVETARPGRMDRCRGLRGGGPEGAA